MTAPSRTNPHLHRLLNGLGLDVEYVRGVGSRLFDATGRGYLDFAGAYGALPFGHNPPEIWAAIEQLRVDAEPSLSQPSTPVAAAELAGRLAELTGLPHSFFVNSGAEAVEAAIKVVRAATGRRLIVSTEGSFHGKTLGALSATGRSRYQQPFGAPAGGFERVPFGSVQALRDLFASRGREIAGFLVEPIQGEGGVLPAPPGYLAEARRLCTAAGAMLILDEVQTGLGRTGRLLAAEHSGVRPDVLTLAKALGGGLVPIGAVSYAEHCLTEDFSLRHTSTFGGNAFCARVGLAALRLLTEDGQRLVRTVAATGQRLRAGLDALAARYPGLVTDVRGAGLLLGLEITADPAAFARQGMLRSLAAAEGLVAHLCGYLLHAEGIRVAPAYFAARVLRVEPPLTVSQADCDTFLAALDRGLGLIAAGDSGRFLAHLSDRPVPVPAGCQPAEPQSAEPQQTKTQPVMPNTIKSLAIESPATEPQLIERRPAEPPQAGYRPIRPRAGEPRWAFLGHPTDEGSYLSFDAGLGLPAEAVKALFGRMRQAATGDTPAGLLVGDCRVVADTAESSYGQLYALPYDARELLDLPTAESVSLIGRAVVEAAEAGATVVGLGAYTSIVTGNALLLRELPVPVTTGNAYTAASALDGVLLAADRRGLDLAECSCVVLGSAGAIGRALALLLAERVGRLALAGNPSSGSRGAARLAVVASDVLSHLRSRPPGGRLSRAAQSDDLDQLAAADLLVTTVRPAEQIARSQIVVAATSSPQPLIPAELPLPGAIICDVSQPPNTGPELDLLRPDLFRFAGGLVELPGRRPLGLDMGLPAGISYACTAETMILAHLGPSAMPSLGNQLDVGLVARLREAGHRLGFTLHLPNQRLDRSSE